MSWKHDALLSAALPSIRATNRNTSSFSFRLSSMIVIFGMIKVVVPAGISTTNGVAIKSAPATNLEVYI